MDEKKSTAPTLLVDTLLLTITCGHRLLLVCSSHPVVEIQNISVQCHSAVKIVQADGKGKNERQDSTGDEEDKESRENIAQCKYAGEAKIR